MLCIVLQECAQPSKLHGIVIVGIVVQVIGIMDDMYTMVLLVGIGQNFENQLGIEPAQVILNTVQKFPGDCAS